MSWLGSWGIHWLQQRYPEYNPIEWTSMFERVLCLDRGDVTAVLCPSCWSECSSFSQLHLRDQLASMRHSDLEISSCGTEACAYHQIICYESVNTSCYRLWLHDILLSRLINKWKQARGSSERSDKTEMTPLIFDTLISLQFNESTSLFIISIKYREIWIHISFIHISNRPMVKNVDISR